MNLEILASHLLSDSKTNPHLTVDCFAVVPHEEIPEPLRGESMLPRYLISVRNQYSVNSEHLVFVLTCVHFISALLLRSMAWSLSTYRSLYPGKSIFDLSQSAKNGRGRTELQHGELPTLATSSTHLWFPSYIYEIRSNS